MPGIIVLAWTAKVTYFVAFAIFKHAGIRMKRLSPGHPFVVAGELLTSPAWLGGLVLTLCGLAMDATAVSGMPMASAAAASGSSMVFVLLIAWWWFGERLTPAEWWSAGFIFLALGLIALSSGLLWLPGLPETDGHGLAGFRIEDWAPTVPLWKTLAIAGVTLGLPALVFLGRERDVEGRHARRQTGVGYGIGAGVLFGAAELSGMAMAAMVRHHDYAVWATPHPYVVLLAGGLGLGLLEIALQRCRLGLVVTIVTIVTKIYMLLVGAPLAGQGWPEDQGLALLRVFGVLIAILAVFTFPRHERRTRPAAAPAEPAALAAGRSRRSLATPPAARPATVPLSAPVPQQQPNGHGPVHRQPPQAGRAQQGGPAGPGQDAGHEDRPTGSTGRGGRPQLVRDQDGRLVYVTR